MKLKETLYITTQVLPGNRIEIADIALAVGQSVEVVVLIPEAATSDSDSEEQDLTLEQRLAFLKLPMSERRKILESQAEAMLDGYREDNESNMRSNKEYALQAIATEKL